MADNIEAHIKIRVDSSELDKIIDKLRSGGANIGGGGSRSGSSDPFTKELQIAAKEGISQRKQEEKAAKDAIKESARIERERIKANADVIKSLNKDKSEQEKTFKDVEKSLKPTEEKKKEIGLYKEWRKVLTGVLIDLHWFRILASQSKVLGANFQIMGRVTGYLLDVILLPMMPALLNFSMAIIGIANFISRLPKGFKLLLAGIVGMILAITVSATAISMAYGLLMKANISIASFSTALDLLSAKIATMTGTPAMGGGALLGGAMAGLGIGLLVVYLMAITGVLGKIYDFGVGFRKWLDKSIASPITIIKNILLLAIGFLKFILDGITGVLTWLKDNLITPTGEIIKPVLDFGNLVSEISKSILNWVLKSLENVVDFGLNLAKIILNWIHSGFQDPLGFVASVLDIFLNFLKREFSVTFNLATSLTKAVCDFIKRTFGIDLCGVTTPTPFGGTDIGGFGGGGVGGRQYGGFITQTGMYKLHAGEKVVPSHAVGDTSIVINIQGNADQRTIDELTKRLKFELLRVRG